MGRWTSDEEMSPDILLVTQWWRAAWARVPVSLWALPLPPCWGGEVISFTRWPHHGRPPHSPWRRLLPGLSLISQQKRGLPSGGEAPDQYAMLICVSLISELMMCQRAPLLTFNCFQVRKVMWQCLWDKPHLWGISWVVFWFWQMLDGRCSLRWGPVAVTPLLNFGVCRTMVHLSSTSMLLRWMILPAEIFTSSHNHLILQTDATDVGQTGYEVHVFWSQLTRWCNVDCDPCS